MDNYKSTLENLLVTQFSIKKEQVEQLISEVENVLVNSSIKDIQKKSLEEMELHLQASQFIETEVRMYREKLYKFAREAAQIDSEHDIVTKSHAIRAKDMVWKRQVRWDFSDSLLTVGALLLGIGTPHVIDLFQTKIVQANSALVVLSILGALLLGMGIVFKAKN